MTSIMDGLPVHDRPPDQRKSRLPSLELCLCHAIWTGSIIYSCWKVFIASYALTRQLDTDDFVKSKLFHGYRKDVADTEWVTFVHLFINHWKWLVIHLIMSICWRGSFRLYAFTLFAAYFITVVLNLKSVIILLANAGLSILITNTRMKTLSYLMFVSLMGFSISPVGILLKKLLFHDSESRILLFDVCLTWFNAKCLSLSVDIISSGKKIAKSDLSLILSYLFYFPSLFVGPVHLYDSFKRDIRSEARLNLSGYFFACLNLLKIFSYAMLLELLLHVIHSKAIQFYPHLTEQLDGWTFVGIGYSLTCLFYLKYYVLYGFAQAVAAFDSVHMPDPPACVSRTCESRMLWRTFDRGLYQWLSEYFYRPIIGHGGDGSITKQLIASAVSFSCVCLWHRCDQNVIVWCLINFVSVAVEKYCHSLKQNIQIKCIMFAPLFALMIISNIFFLSNYEVGMQFLTRIFTHIPVPFLPTMMVMYAGCRVSFSLKGGKDQ